MLNRHIRLLLLLLIARAVPSHAQITPADIQFLALSARSRQLPYEEGGGSMKTIEPIMNEARQSATTDRVKGYRAYTHALSLMNGPPWTPETELATALDFAINAKVVSAGEYLQARATFLFDAPAAANAPYHLDFDILKSDGTSEASIAPGIRLGDIRSRRAGELFGLIFDPSSSVATGLHTLCATLKNGNGTELYRYYRTFFVIKDLSKRSAALEKNLGLLPRKEDNAADTATYILESIRQASTSYLGGSFQNLLAYTHTLYRARNMAQTEVMDFDAELTRATNLLAVLQEGKDPLDHVRGDIRLAYRSTFDGKLVPYRLYIPTSYDRSKKHPMIMTLHGAGGDENNFLDRYQGLWPKLAEERGYIVVSANGRGPTSGYTKESGGEQDVMNVIGLVQKKYNIDPSRIYLAGHSMGASGTWRLGFQYRETFAALAPIAGSRMTPALETALASGRKIPLIIVAGMKDALVPVAGCREVAKKAESLGYTVKYLEYPDGDHLSVAVTSVRDIFDFFHSHRKTLTIDH